MKAVDVVQIAVPCFGDDRQRPILLQSLVLYAPGDDGVTHHADAMGVGDGDWALQESRLLDPRRPRHLAVAVLRKPSGVDRVGVRLSARKYYGDSGPNRPLTYL